MQPLSHLQGSEAPLSKAASTKWPRCCQMTIATCQRRPTMTQGYHITHLPRMDWESPGKAAWTVLKAQLFGSQVLLMTLWFQGININVVLQGQQWVVGFFLTAWRFCLIDNYNMENTDLHSNPSIMANLKLFSKTSSRLHLYRSKIKCIHACAFI